MKLAESFAAAENEIQYSAVVREIVSDKAQIPCPDEAGGTPALFGENVRARIWIKLTDIQQERDLRAAMLKVRSTDANLKQVISSSQFHFGYVYLPD